MRLHAIKTILKPLSGLFLGLTLTALAACSGPEPADVVTEYLSAIEKGDIPAVISMLEFVDADADQTTTATNRMTYILDENSKAINKTGGIKAIEILETSVSEDGTSASVKYELSFNQSEVTSIETLRLVKVNDVWKVAIR